MFKKLMGFIVLFIFLSRGLVAQSISQSLTEEQRDFMGRILGGYSMWEQLLPLIDQFVTGKNPQSGQDKEEEKKITELIMQHPVLVLTLAKYLTSEELTLITDFLASREFKNIVGVMSNKWISKDEKFKQDMYALKEEMQVIWSRVKKQMQGKSSSSIPLITLPVLPMGKNNNPFEDKTNSIEKSLAARQLLEAILPLAEDIIRRKLRENFKNEVEGVRISIAVSRLKDDLKEHPMIIVTLVEYLGMKELMHATEFFSNKEIRSMVERISQKMSSENDQFRRDMQRCLFEIASLPFLQEQSGYFHNAFSSLLSELFQGEIPQPPSTPEGSSPKEPFKETKLPEAKLQKKEPKIPPELLRKEGRKKSQANK